MTDRPELSLIVHSGEFARVHYALVMASAAAAVGREVTLFFTHGALHALGREGGWAALHGAVETDSRYRAAGAGGFEELLAACVELGVGFLACEMGLRVEGLTREDLRADVPLRVAGAVTLLSQAGSGQILFV